MRKEAGTSIKSYFEKNIFKQSLIGFTAMALISVTVTYYLSRYKMTLDLQRSAVAIAEAFRSRILEGDIKAVENQIHKVLGLKNGESAFLLDTQRKHLYRSMTKDKVPLSRCGSDGQTCFDSFTGPGQIFLPIYFDEKKENLFGYLYLTKAVQIDWIYVTLVFSVFSLGYMAILFGLSAVAKGSSIRLASEVEDWSERLKNNPKCRDPLSDAPFTELAPLKNAIEGLTAQIEKYENRAEEKAKLLVLRGIAHDLLSPVSQVQMYLATLEQQISFDEFSTDTIAEIRVSLKKLSMIASQVKTLNESEVSSGTLNLSKSVTAEVEELKKNEIIISKNLQLNLDVKENQVLSSLSNTEVVRILQNLVGNAADASQVGAKINVTVGREGSQSFLTVEDSGHGIPDHLREKVFEPDFTSKPSTGTGLGLFIVKHICEQKQGSIVLKSKRGQGTKITVMVPTNSIERGLHAT